MVFSFMLGEGPGGADQNDLVTKQGFFPLSESEEVAADMWDKATQRLETTPFQRNVPPPLLVGALS